MLLRKLLIAISFLLIATPAHAEWRVAESDYFVVYAEDNEKELLRFAQMLENYHAAMEFVTGREVPKPSPSNRVTIFAVGSQNDIRKLYGGGNRYVSGFYSPRAGGSTAFVPDINMSSGEPTSSMTILLHEYAHHFMISSTPFAMPRWLSEGGAEFFASAKFPESGEVHVGRKASHRAGELSFANDVSIRELLDQDAYAERKEHGYDAYYGRSWLLYHFLTFDNERSGQLAAYQRALFDGEPPLYAAKDAFGDFDVLGKELDLYVRSPRMSFLLLKPEWIETGPIAVRALSKGEDSILPIRIISQRGVNREQALELLDDTQKIARRYPDDAAVLTALAEAEYDAGNFQQAIDTADRAIARDPMRVNAYIQKGYALFRLAEDAEDAEGADAAYQAAMEPFSQLNSIENDHPLPLIYYYRSFIQRGKEPPEQARHALERAAQLAPFDRALWMNVGQMQAKEGKIALASLSLKPVANNPHGGKLAGRAQDLIDAMKDAPEGVPFVMRSSEVSEFSTPDADDDDEDIQYDENRGDVPTPKS